MAGDVRSRQGGLTLENTNITELWGKCLGGILGILSVIVRILLIGLVVAILFLFARLVK